MPSRKLKQSEKAYLVIEKECMGYPEILTLFVW